MKKIRVSNPKTEGVFQGSKWLKVPVLCDPDELKYLLDDSFSIAPLTGFFDGSPIAPNKFLAAYTSWIDLLKQGIVPSDSQLREMLACVWTEDLEALWLLEIPGKGFLTKIARPVVQVQAHYFSYSPVDGVFRSMSMGKGSIFWGLLFSFPQLYQDPQTLDIGKTEENPLFEKIRLWAREKTRPTPFIVDEKKTNVPIRLGKQCFSWIHRHPQLIEQQIEVAN